MIERPLGASALSPEAIAAFKEQLGIHDHEDAKFGWIAEVALQSPLPPRWTCHADEQSGFIYYVDHDRQTSSWENPLVPHLRRIVELGRTYLQNRAHGFFEEQKGILWHQHKHELDCWHGPFTDDEGRKYFVNAIEQVSSWEDPRVDAQYIFELESGLLASLEEVLPSPEGEDPWYADNGAEVLTLDAVDELSPSTWAMGTLGSTRGRQTGGWRKSGTFGATSDLKSLAHQSAKKEHVTTLEQMGSVATKVHGIQQDEEEAQRLALARKVDERKRRRRLQQASAVGIPSDGKAGPPQEAPLPPPPLPGQALGSPDLEEGRGMAVAGRSGSKSSRNGSTSSVAGSKSRGRELPAALELDDEPDDGAGHSAAAPRPPAQLPSPLAGAKPRLLPTLQKRVDASADSPFQGASFAHLELKS